MNFSILFLLSAILFLILLYMILVTKNKKLPKVNLLLILFALMAFWWHAFNYLIQIIDNAETIRLLARIEYVGIIMVPILLYHFSLKVMNLKSDNELKVLYLITAILEGLLLLTDNFIVGFYKYSWGVFPAGGIFHSFFILFVVYITLSILYKIYYQYKKVKILEVRKQLIFLFYGIVFFSMSALDFFPNYGIDVYPLSFVFILIFLGLMFYTISRYNLISTGLFLGRFFVIIIMTIITFGFFDFFEYLKENLLLEITNGWEMLIIKILIAPIFVFIFIEVYKNTLILSKRIFNNFDGQLHLVNILTKINSFNDNREEIINYLVKKLSIILKANIFIVYLENSKINIVNDLNDGETKFSGKEAVLWEIIDNEKEFLILGEEKIHNVFPNGFRSKFLDILKLESIELFLPIMDFYVLIGKKNNSRRYNAEEINFLKKLSMELNKEDDN